MTTPNTHYQTTFSVFYSELHIISWELIQEIIIFHFLEGSKPCNVKAPFKFCDIGVIEVAIFVGFCIIDCHDMLYQCNLLLESLDEVELFKGFFIS